MSLGIEALLLNNLDKRKKSCIYCGFCGLTAEQCIQKMNDDWKTEGSNNLAL